MTRRLSFTKYEQKSLPDFRQRINHTESIEDVKKFFAYAVIDLLNDVFEEKIRFDYNDFILKPDLEPYFTVSRRLLSNTEFSSLWSISDLPQVVGRLAEPAGHRCKRLSKHAQKTDAKIRMCDR
jgi:hypothetical protein